MPSVGPETLSGTVNNIPRAGWVQDFFHGVAEISAEGGKNLPGGGEKIVRTPFSSAFFGFSTQHCYSDVDPDLVRSGFNWVHGSGSGSRGIKSLKKLREKQSLTNKIIFFFGGNYIFQVCT